MNNLSTRLKTIASLVPHGARVCDVGTDHAHLAIFLKASGTASHVIATDLNQKPLDNARANINKSGMTGISLRLCDGLTAVEEDEVDTVIIAGMGGEVITKIISGCAWLKNHKKSIILQPTTSAEVLREFLCKNGFDILSETPVIENSKLYSVMQVRYTGVTTTFPKVFYYIGKIPATRDGIAYIKKQQKRILQCLEAFKNIDSKTEDFKTFEQINDAINKILTENTNVT